MTGTVEGQKIIDESEQQRKDRINALNEHNRRTKISKRLEIQRLLLPENWQEIDEATIQSLYSYCVEVIQQRPDENFINVVLDLERKLLPLKRKGDIYSVRHQRKILGDYGVKRFKTSINRSYDKVISLLYKSLIDTTVERLRQEQDDINTVHEDEKQENETT